MRAIDSISQKISTLKTLSFKIAAWRATGKTIAFLIPIVDQIINNKMISPGNNDGLIYFF